MEGPMMLFLGSLTLFLDSRRNDGEPQNDRGEAVTDFPNGRLTSTAWEGWWHDEA
jgi:hypothetical protein